jgi:hypothetical protein
MTRVALALLAAMVVAACERKVPEKLDLSQPPKKDAAQKIIEGEALAPDDYRAPRKGSE